MMDMINNKKINKKNKKNKEGAIPAGEFDHGQEEIQEH